MRVIRVIRMIRVMRVMRVITVGGWHQSQAVSGHTLLVS